jgi:repressor LexA
MRLNEPLTAQPKSMSDEEADVLIELTERQEQVLEHIYDCIRDGMPPTKAEIAQHFDIWPNSADEIVKALARKGRITLVPGQARGIRVEL